MKVALVLLFWAAVAQGQARLEPLPQAAFAALEPQLGVRLMPARSDKPLLEPSQSFTLRSAGVPALRLVPASYNARGARRAEDLYSCGLFLAGEGRPAYFLPTVDRHTEPVGECGGTDAVGLMTEPGPHPRVILIVSWNLDRYAHVHQVVVLRWNGPAGRYAVDRSVHTLTDLPITVADVRRSLEANSMTLYLATTNPGKLRDFAHALTPGFELKVLPGIEAMPEPDETATTFEGNARIKAEAYSLAAPGLYVLADDSGLEVDALGGAPGVRSARYADDLGFAGTGTKDERNNAALLDALAGRPSRGRYRCVLALARDGQVLALHDGSVEGELLQEPRGSDGFGYDPLFLLPGPGLTMAEIDPVTRQQHSHRARALADLLKRVSERESHANRRRRNAAILAILPALLLGNGALGLLATLALVSLGVARTGEFHGLSFTGTQLTRAGVEALLMLAVCAWAAVRAFRSRVAIAVCGVLASGLLLLALVSAASLIRADFPGKVLGFTFNCLPLLAVGALGLSGTIRWLRVRPWHDIAQTIR